MPDHTRGGGGCGTSHRLPAATPAGRTAFEGANPCVADSRGLCSCLSQTRRHCTAKKNNKREQERYYLIFTPAAKTSRAGILCASECEKIDHVSAWAGAQRSLFCSTTCVDMQRAMADFFLPAGVASGGCDPALIVVVAALSSDIASSCSDTHTWPIIGTDTSARLSTSTWVNVPSQSMVQTLVGAPPSSASKCDVRRGAPTCSQTHPPTQEPTHVHPDGHTHMHMHKYAHTRAQTDTHTHFQTQN